MTRSIFKIPKRVMIVAAHPDDAEFGCGATIAKWVKQGSRAFYLIATNGDKGDDEGKYTPEELAIIREREQHAAAQVIGVNEVVFLPRGDGSLTYTVELRGDVVRWIRTWRPDAVFTHDPTVHIDQDGFVNHADHRAIGAVTIDAVYPFARGRHQYPEQIVQGLEPYHVPEIFLWDAREPNHFEDVAETVELKLEALLCHQSQFPDIDKLKYDVLERLTRAGRAHYIKFAESFQRVKLAH